jgi:hypothetical protein
MIKASLAQLVDDQLIRDLLWATPMRGVVDLIFAREPNYFALGRTQGEAVQTLIAKEQGRVIALATRAVRLSRVNGVIENTGYLADVRLHPDKRGGLVLIKIFRLFKQLHSEDETKIYTALVVEDNKQAISTLLSEKAGFPTCCDLGRVLTPLILVNRNKVQSAELERGSSDNIREIIQVLNMNSQQFSPVYSMKDFFPNRFPGFNIDDFLIIRRNKKIVGVAGIWKQTAIRQTIALRYTGINKVLRPILNYFFGLGLPHTGKPFQTAYMTFVYTENTNDYELLLRECLAIAHKTGITHLIPSVHERDERSSVLDKYSSIPFAGRLFAASLDGEINLDDRVPYIDASTL